MRKQMSRIIFVALFLCISVGVTAQAQQDQPKVVKINDATYMAPLGANVYLVTTPAGNVVIDTGSASVAPDARKLLGAEKHEIRRSQHTNQRGRGFPRCSIGPHSHRSPPSLPPPNFTLS